MSIRPRAIRPGETVGLCLSSGPVAEGEAAPGIAELERLGFRVRVPDDIDRRLRFTAGTVETRVEELHRLFADPEVRAVVCVRGGAGALALLPRLDPQVLRADPKPFVGQSDVTALHLFMARLGLVTVHGPMVARGLRPDHYHRESLLAALTGDGPPYASGPDDLEPLQAGEGIGILRGGCLSLLAAAAGTPWAHRPDPEGSLLFIEDVSERPFRIDRMLTQFRLAGAFDGVRGIVFGEMKGCSPEAGADYALEDVIMDALAGLNVPIAIGLSSGHVNAPNVALPFGVKARLACGPDAAFEVLEPAVQ